MHLWHILTARPTANEERGLGMRENGKALHVKKAIFLMESSKENIREEISISTYLSK